MKRIRVLLILPFFLLLSGCAAAVIAGGAYGWLDGVLQQEYDKSINQTYRAAERALAALEINVQESSHDQLGGKLHGETADGSRVAVEMESLGRSRTQVRVKVGVFGNKNESQRIHEEISSRL